MLILEIATIEPQLSRDLGNYVLTELDRRYSQYKLQRVREAKIFIDDRISEIKQELEIKEENQIQFQERNQNYNKSPNLTLQFSRMQRDINVLKQVFLTLKQQYELVRIEEAKDSTVPLVIDPPNLPIKKSKPKRILLTLLSGVLGLGLALVSIYLKEYFRRGENAEKRRFSQARGIAASELRNIGRIRRA